MMPVVEWTPADHAGGAAIQEFVLEGGGPVRLTGGDAWRWSMYRLIDAEYILDTLVGLGHGKGPGLPFTQSRLVGADETRLYTAREAGGVWPVRPELGRLQPLNVGKTPLWMYQAAQYRGRQVVRASRPTGAAPTFRTARDLEGPPLLHLAARKSLRGEPMPVEANVNGGVFRAGPAVLVLVGVLGVAALAAASYVGSTAVHEVYEVDRYKARVAAETALKSQVAMAKLSAGQPVQLDELVIGAGQAEERLSWLLPVGGFLGGVLVAGAVGVGLWRSAHRRAERAS